MSRSTLTTGVIALLAFAAALIQPDARAQPQPQQSVQALFNRIPKTPATPQESAKMLNAQRQIPAITSLKAEIETHTAAVTKIFEVADAKIRERMGMATTPEQAAQQMNRGAAAAGIDMVRLRNDPAYAQQMQARMRAMSPQELMAMSLAMQQGMGYRATEAVDDPPAVKAAAEAGQALATPEQQAERLATYLRRWTEVDKKVAAVNEKYAQRFPRMRLSCDGEGGGRPECLAERARYEAAMMPLLLARDAEILQIEAAALEEERAALAVMVRSADPHLRAAMYGAASQELGNPGHIFMLDQTLVNDIKVLATRLEEVVKRAAHVTRCGLKILSSPALCH